MNMLVRNAFMWARTRLARQRALLHSVEILRHSLIFMYFTQATDSCVASPLILCELTWTRSCLGGYSGNFWLETWRLCRRFGSNWSAEPSWPHSSSMETCHVFLLLFLLHWGLWLPLTSTGLNSFHRWAETPRIRKCHQSHKVLSSKRVKHQFWLNYPYNTSEVCTTIIQYQKRFIFWGLIPHQVLLFASKV